MTIDDAARIHLFEQARSTWGSDAANTLINAMPSHPDDYATRSDLTSLRGDVASLRDEMNSEFAAVRAEMDTGFGAVRAEMNTEFAAVRTEMHVLGVELRSEISKVASDNLRTLFFGMIASNATLVGLVLAAVKLG